MLRIVSDIPRWRLVDGGSIGEVREEIPTDLESAIAILIRNGELTKGDGEAADVFLDGIRRFVECAAIEMPIRQKLHAQLEAHRSVRDIHKDGETVTDGNEPVNVGGLESLEKEAAKIVNRQNRSIENVFHDDDLQPTKMGSQFCAARSSAVHISNT